MSLTISVTEPDEDVTVRVRETALVVDTRIIEDFETGTITVSYTEDAPTVAETVTEEAVSITVRYKGITTALSITDTTSRVSIAVAAETLSASFAIEDGDVANQGIKLFTGEGLLAAGQGPDISNEIVITSVVLTGVDIGAIDPIRRFGGRPDDDFRVDLNDVPVFDLKRNVQYPDPWTYSFGSGAVKGGDVIDIFLFNGWVNGFTVPVNVVITWADGFTDSFQIYEDIQLTALEPPPSPLPPGYFSGPPQFEQYAFMGNFSAPYRLQTTYAVNEGSKTTTFVLNDLDADD